MEGKPQQKTSWSVLRRQHWGFYIHWELPSPWPWRRRSLRGHWVGLGVFVLGSSHQSWLNFSTSCTRDGPGGAGAGGEQSRLFGRASRPSRAFTASFPCFACPSLLRKPRRSWPGHTEQVPGTCGAQPFPELLQGREGGAQIKSAGTSQNVPPN